MKNSVKIVSFVMAIMILLSLHMTIVTSANNIQTETDITEEKVYCNANMNDDFADDTVLVILKNEISIKCDTYTISDFAEINSKQIEHLSSALEERVKSTLNSIQYSVTHGLQATIDENLNLGEFNQVLSIKLSESGKDKVLAAIEVLEKNDDILYVGPDYYWTYCGEATDSDAYMQGFAEQWAYTQIQLDDAWEYMGTLNISDTPIRIGVIDSGIDDTHPALSSCINSNDSDTYGNDTTRGATVDSAGHGTPIAGIIEGVAKKVELISLKVSESTPVSSSNVYQAIISLNSFDESIPIINFSIAWKNNEGAATSTNYDMVIANALCQYNGLIVGAADNNGVTEGEGADIDNDTNQDYYPSQHNIPNMIIVGASTQSDGIRADSNFGKISVDVFAPGENLYTTTNMLGYTSNQCMTSMATPFVTGLAAMMLMVNDELTPEDIIYIIKETVDNAYTDNPENGADIADLEDACSSGGRINAYEAVVMARNYETCEHAGDVRYSLYDSDSHRVWCNDCDELITTEEHDGYNTSYGTSGHKFYCNLCRYSIMREHDLYVSAIYNDVYTIKCRGCTYVRNCNCDREYVSDGSFGHYYNCLEGCFSEYDSHTYEMTGVYNSNSHEVECIYCYYLEYVDHDLYMYSAAPEDYVVKCYDCAYTIECWESPEYYGDSDDGHWMDCPDGCYSFFEPHTPGAYGNTGEGYHEIECADCGYVYAEDCNYGSAESVNSSYHCLECVDCGYEHTESHVFSYSQIPNDIYAHNAYCRVCQTPYSKPHNWVSKGGGYECLVCGMTTTFLPDYSSLSNVELSLLLLSMSEEELAEFVASLPEDALARVTAILPPVDDDEFLTE